MKKINLGRSKLNVPEIAVGCMRINNMKEEELAKYLRFCLDNGLNFFDHADIYGGGECERIFAKAMKLANIKREEIVIQSKCGIVPGVMYDFSKEHILKSVDGILERLEIEYLDILVLHRPDALVEPLEVAEAFEILKKSGKVRYFGVSNHTPYQIELLKKYLKDELIVNQMQLSIPCSNMIASGLECNMMTEGAINRDGGVLDYCRLKEITLQTWSPFQYGFFEGVYIDSDKYKELNIYLEELAKKYGVTKLGIGAAWILRHPAKMQIVTGTTKIERLKEILAGSEVNLTKEEWYKLYIKAGHILP